MSEPRKWFTFSIRDLIWLMLVVGLIIGWYVDKSRTVAKWRSYYAGIYANTNTLVKRAEEHREAYRADADLFRDLLSRSGESNRLANAEVEKLKQQNQQLIAEVQALRDGRSGDK